MDSSYSASLAYFDYQPSACNASPIKSRRRRRSNTHYLDAFHQRTSDPMDLPSHAELYVKRALPPLPPFSPTPTLRKCSSSDSLCSGLSSRPSTSMTNRQSLDKSLPPLPELVKCSSFGSLISKPSDACPVQVSRPRAGRSINFRGLLHRNSSHSSIEEVPSLTSSISSIATRDSRSDSVLGDAQLALVKSNATTASSTVSKRRPSAISITQIRAASKKVNSAPPPMPTRPAPVPRKHGSSVGSVHRWNPFGRNADEDKEDIPPMPCTPTFIQELSFTQCYYFFARNCNGYVLSNAMSGDACENCARSGYLGSP